MHKKYKNDEKTMKKKRMSLTNNYGESHLEIYMYASKLHKNHLVLKLSDDSIHSDNNR